MGSSVLALLVALISVVTLCAPTLLDLLTEKDSDLRISVQGIHDDRVYLMVTNDGTRAGSFKALDIRFDNAWMANSKQLAPAPLTFAVPVEPHLITPGGTKQIPVEISPDLRKRLDRAFRLAMSFEWRKHFRVVALASVIDFSGPREAPVELPIKLRDWLAGGRTEWHQCLLSFYRNEHGGFRAEDIYPSYDEIEKKCDRAKLDRLRQDVMNLQRELFESIGESPEERMLKARLRKLQDLKRDIDSEEGSRPAG